MGTKAMKLLFVLYFVTRFVGIVEARRVARLGTIDVRSYGARADGRTDDSQEN